jgi:hypothetical protein
MSKKSVVRVRGFGWKLAVAALAVAGVVGTAVAQPVTGTTQGIANMSAGITIQNIANIDVIPKNPAGEDLVFTSANAIDADPTIGTLAKNFGNLGIVKVKTNSNKWDVGMTTQSGGRLLDSASVGCVKVPDIDGWGNNLGTTHDSCSTAGARYLRTGSSMDTVVLDVAIGVAKSGKALGNSGAPATLYPIISGLSGGAPSFIAPVLIDQAKVIASDKSITGTPAVAISFAETIGTYGDTATTWGSAFSDGIYGAGSTGSAEWGTIATEGFPAPKGNEQPQEEYFYVNVGMTEVDYLALNGNQNGTYKEVFYFELFANF